MLRSNLAARKWVHHVKHPLQILALNRAAAANGVIKNHTQKIFFSTGSETAAADYDAKARHVMAFETLVDLQHRACTAYAEHKFLGTRNGNTFDYITYGEFAEKVETCRHVLKSFNVGFDDKVAIISNNREEWAVLCYAALSMGAQVVPMYEAMLETDWRYICNDSDAKLVVAATEDIYERVRSYPGAVGCVQSVVCFDAEAHKPYSFKGLNKKMEGLKPLPPIDNITKEHISTIIYTSGTTGKPKGVELSHENIGADGKGIKALWGEGLGPQTSLCFLPWAHIFGYATELHLSVATGSALAIVPNREQILECLTIVKPTSMVSVPVLFNKVYDGVMAQVNAGSSLKKSIFHFALKVARERNENLEFGRPVSGLLEFQYKMMDKIVFSKIREKMGGNLKYMGSGGAATPLPVIQFFEDIGVPIMEGYGLTETSSAITTGGLGWANRRLGCVGVPLKDCGVRIVDPDTLAEVPFGLDGEITATGPAVMTGYRKNKAANDEVFYVHENKRYFRTGDQGRIVDNKYLKITGRIKEQFKLENGKYVVPAPLEDVFARSPYIAQIMITGSNMKTPCALIVVEMTQILSWLEKNAHISSLRGLAPTPEQLADPSLNTLPLFDSKEFKDLIAMEMDRVSGEVKNYEKPGVWLPVLRPFSQSNQMLTPKMSLRRNNIVKVYGHLLNAMEKGAAGNVIEYTKFVH